MSEDQLQLELASAREQIERLATERDKAAAEVDHERITQLEAENASLRNQLGDNLCWLDHGSTLLDAAKILPETEFLESCRRYHSQLAAERGVFTGGMTIAQLEERIAQLEAALAGLVAVTSNRDFMCRDHSKWQLRLRMRTADADAALAAQVAHEASVKEMKP